LRDAKSITTRRVDATVQDKMLVGTITHLCVVPFLQTFFETNLTEMFKIF